MHQLSRAVEQPVTEQRSPEELLHEIRNLISPK
jgi:hypothetical protein